MKAMDAQSIIAKRIANELRSGMLVNLGIGIPTLVAHFVPAGLSVWFQSENGLIGTGPIPEEGMAHPTLTDAGGRPVTALPGASTFDSAMSFGLIRGGHVDVTVLGARPADHLRQPRDTPRLRLDPQGDPTFLELREMLNSGAVDPMHDFSAACRAEVDSFSAKQF